MGHHRLFVAFSSLLATTTTTMMTRFKRLPVRPRHRVPIYDPLLQSTRPNVWPYFPKTDAVVFAETQFIGSWWSAFWVTQTGRTGAYCCGCDRDHNDDHNDDDECSSSYGQLPSHYEMERCLAVPVPSSTKRHHFFCILLDHTNLSRTLWEANASSTPWIWQKLVVDPPPRGQPILFRYNEDQKILWMLEAGSILSLWNIGSTPNTFMIRRYLPPGYGESKNPYGEDEELRRILVGADCHSNLLVYVDGSSMVYFTHTHHKGSKVLKVDLKIQMQENPSLDKEKALWEWTHVCIERVMFELVESKWCVICFLVTTSRNGVIMFWRIEFLAEEGGSAKQKKMDRLYRVVRTKKVTVPGNHPQQVFMGTGGRIWMVPPYESLPFRMFLRDTTSPMTRCIVGHPRDPREEPKPSLGSAGYETMIRIPSGGKSGMVQWFGHHVWFWDLEDGLKSAMRGPFPGTPSPSLPMDWWSLLDNSKIEYGENMNLDEVDKVDEVN